MPADCATLSCITSPAPGSMLWGTATFQWTAVSGVEAYWLSAGSTVGGEQYYSASQGTALQGTIRTLPVSSSSVIHVRLYTKVNGTWRSRDYTYHVAEILMDQAGATPSTTIAPPSVGRLAGEAALVADQE